MFMGILLWRQSTSVANGTYLNGATPVARVIADIGYDGKVDTSTALFNVFNGNNPRSVATVDGTSFYISGQGQSGDTTQGLFHATDGASSATSIDDGTDTRTVEIYNGQLYLSRDSKQMAPGTTGSYTANISTYGAEPTTATAPGILPGISQTATLTPAEQNGVNDPAKGGTYTADLSPENYFFANADTLYIADGGNPKGNTSKHPNLGDGGLQKWVFNGTAWTLQYTVAAGLNLVPDTAASGTTGLIGLTGVDNSDGTVTLYATNATLTDTGQTYLYKLTDILLATSDTGEAFTKLLTAAPDTNIRGVAFAPTCFYPGTAIATPAGETAVENLRPGDLVQTASGAMPVRWIGHSHVSTRFADPLRVLPIRIRAGALGAGLPVRDLLLSPEHAVFIDGILAQAGALVNGVSIVREHDVPEQFTYFHVELTSHELLYAEGALAESFVDNVDRANFHNWLEREVPEEPIAELPYPRAKAARQLPRHLRAPRAA